MAVDRQAEAFRSTLHEQYLFGDPSHQASTFYQQYPTQSLRQLYQLSGRAEQNKKFVKLWSDYDLDGGLSGMAPYSVNGKFAREYPEAVKDFVTAIAKAANWVNQNPDKAREHVAKRLKMDVNHVDRFVYVDNLVITEPLPLADVYVLQGKGRLLSYPLVQSDGFGGRQMETSFTISSGDIMLAATFHQSVQHHEATKKKKHPLVIICHGFVGNRIGVNRLFVKAARDFSEHGFAVLRFDFEGCGESTGDYGKSGLDRFIEQTKDVIEYALTLPHIDDQQLILLGHSLGGAVAMLTACRDPRVKKLVLWSAVGNPFKDIVQVVGRENYEESLRKPFIDYEGYPLTKRFFDSLALFHPLQESIRYTGDVCLVHGQRDEVIPAEYSCLYQRQLNSRKQGTCSKVFIEKANHTFSSIYDSNQLFLSTRKWLLDQTTEASLQKKTS